MSQQHAQFEEEFRDGPPSGLSYQGGYTGPQPLSYTVNVPPLYSQVSMPGQKLVVQDLNSGKAPGAGQRLFLAIFSIFFIFVTFMIALAVIYGVWSSFPAMIPLVMIFALIFAAVVIIINLIFNRKH